MIIENESKRSVSFDDYIIKSAGIELINNCNETVLCIYFKMF